MPFLEHLEELRRVILGSIAAVMICSVAAYAFSGTIIDFIVVSHVGEAQFLRPMEAFVARIKVSLLVGLLVGLPFVTFQIWNFVVPGLLQHERKIVLPLVFSSTLLFLVGTAFSYLVLTPMMLKVLVGFATTHIRPNITVDYLLDFIIKMAVACGILFQLPLVVAVLTLFRVLTPRFLWSKWRHAIVAILIVAAVATPGDGPSQIILAAPIVVLYFLSILLSMMISRGQKKKDAAAAGAADPDAPVESETGAPDDSGTATLGDSETGAPDDSETGPPDGSETEDRS